MKMRILIKSAALIFALPSLLCAQSEKRSGFVNPYGWSAENGLGTRIEPGKFSKRLGKGKQIGIFYWPWHTQIQGNLDEVNDLSKILKEHPEAANEKDHPAWKGWNRTYYWAEPLFGYYLNTDKWVLRKHAELLAAAGVDFVLFDCTNGAFTWMESVLALIAEWEEAAKDGVKSPKIAYMSNFAPFPSARDALIQIYQTVYKPGRGKDLWFMLDGKPLVLAYPEMLENGVPEAHKEICKEIRSFFTFRPPQPDYVDGPQRADQWSWLECYPQNGYVEKEDGTFEMISVGVSQNANAENGGHAYAFNHPGAYGRSFSMINGHDDRPDAYLYGANFKEQWERAFEVDPEIVFVTGWNEWTAGRHENWPPYKPNKPFAFPDQYDNDRSRDIEPVKTWGENGDAYYLLLVENVRKFKRIISDESALPMIPKKTLDIGKESDWNFKDGQFNSYRNTNRHRDALGAARIHYTNTSGRNSISSAKVAYDDNFVYFLALTDNALTPKTDAKWMRLFIDADNDRSTGWEGYDILVNKDSPLESASVHAHAGGSQWKEIEGAEYAVFEKALALKLPRKLFGAPEKPLRFNFKWSDNMQEEDNVMDFYVNGSCAPIGRFNFSCGSE